MGTLSESQKGIISVIVGSLFLGSIGIFVRYAGTTIEPMTQSFARIFLAFVFITLFNLVKSSGKFDIFTIKSQDIKWFVLNGVVGFSVLASAFTLSILYTTITNTYFLLYTAPVFVVIFSYTFLKERVQNHTLIVIAVSFLGLIFLFNPSNLTTNLTGNLFGLLTGVAFGAYFVVTSFLSKKQYSSPVITFWTQLFGALGLFPLIFIFDKEVNFMHSLAEWLPVIAAGAVVFIGYALLNLGLKKITATTGSILSLFEPLSSIMYSIVFFSEFPANSAWIGALLILMSIVYLTYQTQKEK